jgi:protein gp37
MVGCSKISTGCQNCYAERMAARLATMPQSKSKYTDAITDRHWSGKVITHLPTLVNVPHRPGSLVFVNSMSDTFHGMVHDAVLAELFARMAAYPETTYIVLTKRASGMSQRYNRDFPSNVWIGATVEDRSVVQRVYDLAKCRALVRWISMEPLLGPVEIPYLDRLHWVVVGCETGPGRRPCHLEWVKDIIEQCDRARVPVFVKKLEIAGEVTGDLSSFPPWARRREWPK